MGWAIDGLWFTTDYPNPFKVEVYDIFNALVLGFSKGWL
jgi:hypothetical protein